MVLNRQAVKRQLVVAWMGVVLITSVLHAKETSKADAQNSLPAMDKVVVLGQSPAASISLGVGQTVRIEVEGNPTTGYLWSLRPFASNAVHALEKIQYEPNRNKLVGAGGIFYIRLKGDRAGVATLRFEYGRPWKNNQPPEIIKIVTVDVLDKK